MRSGSAGNVMCFNWENTNTILFGKTYGRISRLTLDAERCVHYKLHDESCINDIVLLNEVISSGSSPLLIVHRQLSVLGVAVGVSISTTLAAIGLWQHSKCPSLEVGGAH